MKRMDTGVTTPTLRAAVTVAVLIGSGVFASPAAADQFGISISTGAVGFSYNSGGYCDAYGCPDRFWDYPVYYCPVYFQHRWYRGPVYYSRRHGDTYYWIRSGWRRDQWDGPRPPWACNDRYGPALDLYFYQSNGFRVRDAWWNSWGREHNDWYWRDHPNWNRNQNSGGRISQGQEWDRARAWTGVSHPWAGARDQGSQRGGMMGVSPSHNPGAGNAGEDQGMRHHGADRGTPPGSSMSPSAGQGNPNTMSGSRNMSGSGNMGGSGNMSGAGASQGPGPGQAADHGDAHRTKPSDTGDQGNSGGASHDDSGAGRGHDNPNSRQNQNAPDSSGNDKGGKKHGDQGGDQNNPGDHGNGNPH